MAIIESEEYRHFGTHRCGALLVRVIPDRFLFITRHRYPFIETPFHFALEHTTLATDADLRRERALSSWRSPIFIYVVMYAISNSFCSTRRVANNRPIEVSPAPCASRRTGKTHDRFARARHV